MTGPSVALLDYGSGNVHSAAKALELAGARVELTADRAAATAADGLVVPGVGAFAAVMAGIERVGAAPVIEQRLVAGRPVLGVCVGMQVLFERGVEGESTTAGLGQWPGEVTRLAAPVVPHMGWNTVEAPADSVLFEGIGDERFYFVHSYAAANWELDAVPPFAPARLTWTRHGGRFLAAVENGPLSATQFHPEKSGPAGIRLLRNWLATL